MNSQVPSPDRRAGPTRRPEGRELIRFAFARNCWSLVIRGFLGILVGILAFVWPGITLAALVFLFAGYALVDGAMSITGAVRAAAAHERWGTCCSRG